MKNTHRCSKFIKSSLLLLSICLLLSACVPSSLQEASGNAASGSEPVASSQSGATNISSSSASSSNETAPAASSSAKTPEPAADDELLAILQKDDIEGTAMFFLYLLENYEKAKPFLDERNNYDRFAHILLVYERDGLSTAEFDVIAFDPVDIRSLVGEFDEPKPENVIEKVFYKLTLNIKDGGAPQFPLGETEWLVELVELSYRYINRVMEYDSAADRLMADTVYRREAARTSDDAFYLHGLTFANASEISPDTLIFYLMCHDVTEAMVFDEDDYYGTAMTQEEIDVRAKKYFNIDKVD